MFGSSRRPSNLASRPSDLASYATTLIISNEEMNDIMKMLSHLKNLVY